MNESTLVDLTIDALKDWKEQGTVSYIAPAADSSNGVVTYAVRVSFPDSDDRVKVGMTANLMITTAKKDGVLLVPNSALLPKGKGPFPVIVNYSGYDPEINSYGDNPALYGVDLGGYPNARSYNVTVRCNF